MSAADDMARAGLDVDGGANHNRGKVLRPPIAPRDEAPAIEWADAEPEPDTDPKTKRPSKPKREPRAGHFERGDHVELAERLLADLAPPGELVFAESALWRYVAERGRWARLDTHESSRIVQGYAGLDLCEEGAAPKPMSISAGDVAGALKLAQAQAATLAGDEPFFAASSAALAFTNGVLRVDGDALKLEPAAPEHRARHGFPFDFNGREQAPPRFLAFLNSIFRDDADRAEKVDFVQEFFGACVLGIATRFEVCLVAYGETAANGKSTLIDVATSCMPDRMVSAIPPQDMAGEYARAKLMGIHLNAVEELPEREIFETGAFKSITTGGLVGARRIYGEPFEYHPIAGHVFAANTLPSSGDLTDGFWRRVAVVTFNRSFTDDPEKHVGLSREILAAERPAIVSWFAHGAARALQRGAYALPPSHFAARARWRTDSNPVALFVEQCTRPLAPHEQGVMADQLYRRFREWSERNGHKVMARNTFGGRMRLLGNPARHTKFGSLYPVIVRDDS